MIKFVLLMYGLFTIGMVCFLLIAYFAGEIK